MINFLNKNILLILNIVFGLIIFPLLFILSIVNVENIFQFNFGDIYTIIYFLYLFLGIFGLLFLRFIKIKNDLIHEELLYTIKQVFLISLLVIPSFFINHHFLLEYLGESNLYLRSYGKIAFVYFALSLSISPILKFIKNSKLRDILILSRKVFGILSFVFFFKHGLEYFATEYIYQVKQLNTSYLEYVIKNMLVRFDALSGFVAGVMMMLLGITSNKFSVKILSGKGWKKLQSLVFPAFIISVIHIAFSSRFDNFYTFLFVFVVSIRTFAYLVNNNKEKTKTDKTTTKYICVPCGYIYDESKGDPDSGIIPGTKFADIPDDWYCPVCGVGKSDFEPYYDGENTIFGGYLGQVIGYNMLTNDVLELVLKVDNLENVLKGQYAILLLNDFDGDFSRAYSIVSSINNTLTFGIKLSDTGRGGRALKNVKIGDIIKVKGIYGNFVLKDTTNPKVFIATGTGLSPIMNMLSDKLPSLNNYLFFGAQTQNDLFYLDKINSIENLSVNIYISREQTEKYNNGRIDLTKFSFAPETEFYICGNPGVVTSTKEYLQAAGFQNVYLEKF